VLAGGDFLWAEVEEGKEGKKGGLMVVAFQILLHLWRRIPVT
jgi:hypothetical protein